MPNPPISNSSSPKSMFSDLDDTFMRSFTNDYLKKEEEKMKNCEASSCRYLFFFLFLGLCVCFKYSMTLNTVLESLSVVTLHH